MFRQEGLVRRALFAVPKSRLASPKMGEVFFRAEPRFLSGGVLDVQKSANVGTRFRAPRKLSFTAVLPWEQMKNIVPLRADRIGL